MSNSRHLRKDIFRQKCSQEEFSEYYMSHPSASIDELCEELGVSRRSIYYKKKAFDVDHKSFIDPRLSKMILEAYKDGRREGFEEGALMGGAISGLLSDILTREGIGIGDLIHWIATNAAGQPQAAQPQPTATATTNYAAETDINNIYG